LRRLKQVIREGKDQQATQDIQNATRLKIPRTDMAFGEGYAKFRVFPHSFIGA
jgi:hypothetical protein